ncbi:unnamed protein product, partial [Oppiella nova]
MTKSSCIVFILMFAILFDLEKKRFSLIIVVSLISSGLFMFTYHSTQFQIQGFLLVLSASLLGGLRWTLSQLVMQRKEVGLSNPLDMMYHIQPWMLLGLIPLAIMFEGIPFSQSKVTISQILSDSELLWQTLSLIMIGSVLAFFMEFSEFLLLTYTSSLTLSIAGIFKEVFTLYLAVNYNGDQMSRINFIGLIVCLLGIALHVVIKALDTTGKKFHYPLSVVTCHMIVKLMIAYFLRLTYKSITGVSRISLSWDENVRKLSATGIASALDIGFSNWSFEFITISLYTMTKSSCIVFILMFAILFDLEKK